MKPSVADLGDFVSQELGLDPSATLSACVFCKVPFQNSRLTKTKSGKCEIKVLHCLHSACGRCLEEALGSSQEVMCPLCDARVIEQDYHKYLCNFAVHQGIDYSAVKEQDGIACDECVESSPAVTYCQRCVRSLCKECSEHHRRSKATNKHALVTLRDQQEHSMHRAAFCPAHPDRPVEFFCQTCSVVCCRTCILAEHENHDYKLPVGTVVQRHRQKVQDRIDQLRETAGLLQERHQDLTQMMQGFDREVDSCYASLDAVGAQVKAALHARRQVLSQEIDSFTSWYHSILDKKKNFFANEMGSMWRAIEFVEKVLTHGNDIEVLFLKSYVSTRHVAFSWRHFCRDESLVLSLKERLMASGSICFDGNIAAATKRIAAMGQAVVREPRALREVPGLKAGALDADAAGVSGAGRTAERPAVAEVRAVAGQERPSPEAGTDSALAAESCSVGSSHAHLPASATSASSSSHAHLPASATSASSSMAEEAPNPFAEARKPISLVDALVGSQGQRPSEPPVKLALAKTLQQCPAVSLAVLQPAQLPLPGASGDGVHRSSNEQLAHSGIGRVSKILGSEGDRPGLFHSPCGMAVDSECLYIADTLNHRIQVFDKRSYKLMGTVQIPGDRTIGQLQDPSGLCCPADRCLVVVEYGLDRMLYIRLATDSLEAVDVWTFGNNHLYGPFGVGFSQGQVIVADSCNHRCLVLSITGQLHFEFGTRGSGPGQFEYPECVAVFGDRHIAISDKDNHRIQVFDWRGVFCHYIPSCWGPGDLKTPRPADKPPVGHLRGPMGMCCDKQDRLYVCDCGGDRVQIFTRQGQWLWSSSGPEGTSSNFASPTAMAIDTSGKVYVASDHCVQVF